MGAQAGRQRHSNRKESTMRIFVAANEAIGTRLVRKQ
jgi:hypothetical protein